MKAPCQEKARGSPLCQVNENFTWPDVAIEHAGWPARRCRAHCGRPLRPADVGQHRVERADSVEGKRRGIGDKFCIVECADKPFAIVGHEDRNGGRRAAGDAPTLLTSTPSAANSPTIRLPKSVVASPTPVGAPA